MSVAVSHSFPLHRLFLGTAPRPLCIIEGEAARHKHAHGATLHGRSALTNRNTIPDPGVWQRVRFVCGVFTCLPACTLMCVCTGMEASRSAGLCEKVFSVCVCVRAGVLVWKPAALRGFANRCSLCVCLCESRPMCLPASHAHA
jgi:hypothetical protein